MFKLLLLLVFSLLSKVLMAQCNKEYFDTLVLQLNNNKISELWYSPSYTERDSNQEVILRNAIVYSNDLLLRTIATCGKEYSDELIRLMGDEDKDYAANFVLYMIYKSDAFIFGKFYLCIENL